MADEKNRLLSGADEHDRLADEHRLIAASLRAEYAATQAAALDVPATQAAALDVPEDAAAPAPGVPAEDAAVFDVPTETAAAPSETSIILLTPEENVAKRKSVKKPKAPKAAVSAYRFFHRDNESHLEWKNRQWNCLTDDEKKRYQGMAVVDEKRYNDELLLFKSQQLAIADTINDLPCASSKNDEDDIDVVND